MPATAESTEGTATKELDSRVQGHIEFARLVPFIAGGVSLDSTSGSTEKEHMMGVVQLTARVWALCLTPALGSIVFVDDSSTGPIHDGASWCNAYLYLQDALVAVESGDTIHIAHGTYKPDMGVDVVVGAREATFELVDGVVLEGGYAGCGHANPDARDAATFPTILSGDLAGNDSAAQGASGLSLPEFEDNAFHVITALDAGAGTIVRDLIIVGGNANSTDDANGRQGGGAFLRGATPAFIGCTFQNNQAAEDGGGLFADDDSHAVFDDCRWIQNAAVRGGGVCTFNSTPVFERCEWAANVSHEGGGVYTVDANAAFADCRFWANRGSEAGGAVFGSNGSSTFDRCHFLQNTAGRGGAYSSTALTHATFDRCIFDDNAAFGGIGLFADSGGAMYLEGVAYVSSSLFIRNRALEYAVARTWGFGVLAATNCTVVGNQSFIGQSSWGSGSSRIRNSIVWDSGSVSTQGGVILFENSIIEGGQFLGETVITDNPMFVSPSRDDFRLRSESPGVDVANAEFLEHVSDLDLAGLPRVVEDSCSMGSNGNPLSAQLDIGAYEHQAGPNCGDGDCSSDESCDSCPCDCGECICGDGLCNLKEDCLNCPGDCNCNSLFVPTDFPSIQAAVDASQDGDTIIISPGVYSEAIRLAGRSIRLESLEGPELTIVDSSRFMRPAIEISGNDASMPTIQGFGFTGTAHDGAAGASIAGGSPQFHNCRFSGCQLADYAIQAEGGNPTFVNCAVVSNAKAGVLVRDGLATLINCTIAYNGVNTGLSVENSSVSIRNSIVWGDHLIEPGQSVVDLVGDRSSLTVQYSNVFGGAVGESNIDSAPLFMDPIYGDFRLRSDSPCVDAANNDAYRAGPATDLLGRERFSERPCTADASVDRGALIDMGALETQSYPQCGDGMCDEEVESCTSCPCDCGTCTCGDGICSVIEHYVNCPEDCLQQPLVVPRDFERIQDAIVAARPGDEIVVEPGTYYEHLTIAYKPIVLRSEAGAESTRIIGLGHGESVVEIVADQADEISIQGFTVTGGYTTSGGGVKVLGGVVSLEHCRILNNRAVRGAGIYIAESDVHLDHTEVSGNIAETGGGVYVTNSSSLSLNNCVLDENEATEDWGGALYSRVPVTIETSTFSRNRGTWGGAIYARNHSFDISHSTFFQNQSNDDGGAVYVRDLAATFLDCEFRENVSGRNGGGSIAFDVDGQFTSCRWIDNVSAGAGGGHYDLDNNAQLMAGCEWFGNIAAEGGGGLFATSKLLQLQDCLWHQNTARFGGGLYNAFDSQIEVENSRFMRNEAELTGGALASAGNLHAQNIQINENRANLGAALDIGVNPASLVNCTIYNNVPEGGVLDSPSPAFFLHNCIIWGNELDVQETVNTATSIDYSLVQGGADGTGNIDADPLFRNPERSEFQLQSGSPAIDAGDNEAVLVSSGTDLAGNPRFVDHVCAPDVGSGRNPIVDLGAYEFQENEECGDARCSEDENCESCACDCGECCGDGECQGPEDCFSCKRDCACRIIFVPDEYGTIQDAINVAGDGDEVVVAAGTYPEAIDFQGKAITVVAPEGPERTTIDASGLGVSAVKCVNGETRSSVLDGFTITGGNAIRGGGLMIIASSPEVRNCRFVQNAATDLGGALYCIDSQPVVRSCEFISNTSQNRGGAVYDIRSAPIIEDCMFVENFSYNVGGAIYSGDGSPSIDECNFLHNAAENIGGAIYCDLSDAVISNSLFEANEASNGSAIRIQYCNPTLAWLTFKNQTRGHVVYSFHGDPVIGSCAFIQNPGGYAFYGVDSNPTMANCSIIGNLRTVGNNGGLLKMANSIAWFNEFPSPGLSMDAESAQISYCNIEGGWTGAGNIDLDPLFFDWPNGDIRLRSASPSIDSGDDAAVKGIFDINGNDRLIDHPCVKTASVVDMGAVEVQVDAGCGDGMCASDVESCLDCHCDCGICCGNGNCDTFEDCNVCKNDCPCPESRDWYVPGDFPSIQEAITASRGGDSILVGPGTYREAIDFEGKALRIQGTAGASETTIDADGLDAWAVNCSDVAEAGALFRGFTVTRGRGGMRVFDASPEIRDCAFVENVREGSGAGLLTANSSAAISNCVFEHNSEIGFATTRGSGLQASGDVRVEQCLFRGNRADFGGGLSLYGSSEARDCVFIDNAGGAVYMDGVSILHDSLIIGSSGSGFRSGSILVDGDAVTISSCRIRDNGLRAVLVDGGSALIVNCLVHDNVAGILEETDSAFQVHNSTIVFNRGYGIKMSGTLNVVSNCIVHENVDNVFGNAAYAYSNIGGSALGEHIIDADPVFLDPSTGDFRLASDSPSVDAGNNAGIPEMTVLDLGGDPRIADGGCESANVGNRAGGIVDHGAFELTRMRTCGNGICDAGETCLTCHCDCGGCEDNGQCDSNEDCLNDPEDCPCRVRRVPHDYASIQAAVDASRDGDEVLVFPGTYAENVNVGRRIVTLRSAAGPATTVVDGSGNEASVLTYRVDGRATCVLDGFHITGGLARDGGGVNAHGSDLLIRNCRFSQNEAVDSGGAVYHQAGTLEIDNCEFDANRGSIGGAVALNGTDGWITSSLFERNTSNVSGAVSIESARIELKHTDFIRNRSFGSGGALRIHEADGAVAYCKFVGQSAESAGGVGLIQYANVAFQGSLFVGNLAGGEGGGFRTFASEVTLNSCTFSENVGEEGGSIAAPFNTTILAENSIFWNSWPETVSLGSSTFLAANCLSDEELPGKNNLLESPQFVRPLSLGPDALWGTDDDDFGDQRLSSGSPAIDMGSTETLVSALDVDLDDNARHVCDRLDIGAYEFQADYNCDGRADLRDCAGLLACLDHEVGSQEKSPCDRLDTNRDGRVNLNDLAILLFSMGLTD